MDKSDIRLLWEIVETFREFDATMPIQHAQAFLVVALMDEPTISDVAQRANLTTASASRNIQALREERRAGRPGLGLVRVEPDPMDGRVKRLRLTPKGDELLQRLTERLAS